MSTDTLIESVLFEGFGRHLHEQRFLFLTADALGGLLAVTPRDVASFADHWPRLTLDQHMGDGGTYRYRRYGEFDAPSNAPRRQMPHGPYEQPTYINGLNGGVSRRFDPLEPSFVADPVVNRLLDWLTRLCDQCEGSPQHWNIRLRTRTASSLARRKPVTPPRKACTATVSTTSSARWCPDAMSRAVNPSSPTTTGKYCGSGPSKNRWTS